MVAIKDIEMPSCCTAYNSDNGKYEYISCPFYQSCKQRERIKTNYKPANCPLVEIITCENCNNHGLDKEHHPDIDGARYCPTLHTYTGYDYYCGDAERREHEQL